MKEGGVAPELTLATAFKMATPDLPEKDNGAIRCDEDVIIGIKAAHGNDLADNTLIFFENPAITQGQ